jgi:hypothetical protein
MTPTTSRMVATAGEAETAVQAEAPPSAVWREAILVGVVAAIVYRLTLSAVPALTHDSTGYMLAIETGGDALYHPHHLAYNVLSRWWLNLSDAVGVGGDPYRTVEMLNAVFGAVAAGLVWTILRLRAALPRTLAAAGTAGAALSYGVWFYSVSVEVYLLPLTLLLATFLALTTPHLTPRTMIWVGLLNGLAVIAHQINVLFAVVVLATVTQAVDRSAAARYIATYAATAAAAVGAAYGAVLAFAIRPGSASEAGDWFTRYAHESVWHFEPTAPVQAAAGFARSLVGGQFAYRLGSVREQAARAFPGKSLDDEAFLVRGLAPILAVGLIVLAVVGAGLLLTSLVRGARRRDDLPTPARRLLRPLIAWLLGYSAFFLFWEPLNPEFWIPQGVVVWMLASVLASAPVPIRDGRPPALPGAAVVLLVAAAAVGIANFAGTVLPATDASNDVYAQRYGSLSSILAAGDLVVVDQPHLGLGYADRYTDADGVAVTNYTYVVSAREERNPSPGDIADTIERTLASGHLVAIDAELIDDPSDGTAERAGDVFADRFGDRWGHVGVPDASGWYVISP